MFQNEEIQAALVQLGARVRSARIARGDDQRSFAKRIGVSTPTLRALEQGEPTVALGTFLATLWALSRLTDADQVLSPRESMFDRIERHTKARLRASKRTKLSQA